MPRYFLHIRRDADLIEDPDGSEFGSVAEAIEEARRAAADLVIIAIQTRRTIDDDRIEVRDEMEQLVVAVDLTDLLPIRSKLQL